MTTHPSIVLDFDQRGEKIRESSPPIPLLPGACGSSPTARRPPTPPSGTAACPLSWILPGLTCVFRPSRTSRPCSIPAIFPLSYCFTMSIISFCNKWVWEPLGPHTHFLNLQLFLQRMDIATSPSRPSTVFVGPTSENTDYFSCKSWYAVLRARVRDMRRLSGFMFSSRAISAAGRFSM